MPKHCASYRKQSLRICIKGGEKTRSRREKKRKERGRQFVVSPSIVSEESVPLRACPWFSVLFHDFLMTCFLIHKSETVKINIVAIRKLPVRVLEAVGDQPLHQLSGNGLPWVSNHISNSPGSRENKWDTWRIQKGDVVETVSPL